MILSKKKKLINKIKTYDLIIFDLDNTIFNLKYFDKEAILKVSDYFSNILKIQKDKIFKVLIKNKNNETKKNLKLDIFNSLLISHDTKNTKNTKNIVKNCIRIYQNHIMKKIKFDKTLLEEIKYLYQNKKDLYLVTNGNYQRQLNKIKSLKIEKYFKKIHILDDKKKMKPSILSVRKLKQLCGHKNSVMVGDSIIDKKFASNLSVDYIRFINDF
jgi:FMN phosphatase YigB (HAD superfamily)